MTLIFILNYTPTYSNMIYQKAGLKNSKRNQIGMYNHKIMQNENQLSVFLPSKSSPVPIHYHRILMYTSNFIFDLSSRFFQIHYKFLLLFINTFWIAGML